MIKNKGSADAQQPRRGARGNSLAAETAIREARKNIDYSTIEYPIECLVDKIDRQEMKKDFHWDEVKQSSFVESLILGFPVLNIVFISKNWNAVGENLELIDGKQRLYTAINFLEGNLELCNLKTLTALNGFKFSDLVLSRQKKFRRISVRAISIAPQCQSAWRSMTRHPNFMF